MPPCHQVDQILCPPLSIIKQGLYRGHLSCYRDVACVVAEVDPDHRHPAAYNASLVALTRGLKSAVALITRIQTSLYLLWSRLAWFCKTLQPLPYQYFSNIRFIAQAFFPGAGAEPMNICMQSIDWDCMCQTTSVILPLPPVTKAHVLWYQELPYVHPKLPSASSRHVLKMYCHCAEDRYRQENPQYSGGFFSLLTKLHEK